MIVTASHRRDHLWSDERDATLRELYTGGAAGETIANRINRDHGTRYTANAINVRARIVLHLVRDVALKQDGITARRPGVVWTDAMNEQLRALIDQRKTYNEVARVLGLNHGAVVRQIYALCITVPRGKRHSPEELAALQETKQEKREQTWRTARLDKILNFVPGEYRKEVPLPIRPDPVADPLNLTMDELAPGRVECRMITTHSLEPPLFCGHPTVANGSWCAKHREVVLS